MARVREDTFTNLKLDANSFFTRMLRHDAADRDIDLYLMETSLMPVLLQGLDALSKQVDNNDRGHHPFGEASQPFNPLTWLALFMLRNHPRYLQDHRAPMYKQLAEMASIERGRRCLLRRKGQIEAVWEEVEAEKGRPVTASDLPRFFCRLDRSWNLDGAFARSMPTNCETSLEGRDASTPLPFHIFWDWFEGYVKSHDIIREGSFTAAVQRQVDSQRVAEAKADLLDADIEAAKQRRADLDEEFQTIAADMYVDQWILKILHKGAVLSCTGVRGGGAPLEGDHITLILSMLRLWERSFGAAGPGTDAGQQLWDGEATIAWTRWLRSQGLLDPAHEGTPDVDADRLRALISLEDFREHLVKAIPIVGEDLGSLRSRCVEVVDVDAGDHAGVVADVVDPASYERISVSVPASMVEGLTSLLDEWRGKLRVMVTADMVKRVLLNLHPPAEHSVGRS